MRTSIMVGISGYCGKALMEAMLNSRHFKKVIVLTRRENKRIKNIHLKKVTVDFGSIENYKEEFVGVDDVFCLLGTDFINTDKLEDAQMFEFEYPLGIAKIAKQQGVKNFFLLNPNKASESASSDKYRLRAKLAKEIEKLNFENFYLFKVNGVGKPVNLESSLFAAQKSLGTIINLLGLGLLDKVKITPANLLANKMIEVAVSNPLQKREFTPADYK